jgi:hypothetical protein
MPWYDEDKRSMGPLNLDGSLSSSSFLDSSRFGFVRFISRRRRIVVTAVAVCSVFYLLAYTYPPSSRPLLVAQDHDPAPALSESLNRTPSLDRKSAILGPPTSRFRGLPQKLLVRLSSLVTFFGFHSDNLRSDTKYITSWISAGWCKSPPHH